MVEKIQIIEVKNDDLFILNGHYHCNWRLGTWLIKQPGAQIDTELSFISPRYLKRIFKPGIW